MKYAQKTGCEVCGANDHDLETCPETPYIRGVQSLLMSFSLPVRFSNEAGRRVHATMTAVDTGDAILGVTAGHVADRIIQCCSDEIGRQCQIGSTLLPANSLIARHSDLDLATFRLSASVVAAAGRQAAPFSDWPPAPPQNRDLVMVGGYPGVYRRANLSKQQLESDFASFGARVTYTDDRKFTIEIPLANSFSVSEKLIPPHTDIAGISGGGVFRLTETHFAAGIEGRLDLIGIVYSGSPGFEVIHAHPLSCMERNGEFS